MINIESRAIRTITSWQGPTVVTECLENDKYRVRNMVGTRCITRQSKYEQMVATDQMKPYQESSGVFETEEVQSDAEEL